ncbi:phage baseplate assembly protein [Pararhizobium sp. O133]|uniref:phage baseplate assembly protein n=1 Tax=Pararhizobium sp. O133 TaxID=3449278 RepID=UPI003F688971
MMLETVLASGLPPHESISISVSAEEAVRTASMVVAYVGPGLPAIPGQPVSITASGTLILTGYVRDVNPSHDAETRSCSLTIVSRTVDATECSVLHSTGEVLDKDLAAIAREFDGLGIGVEDDGGLPKEVRHKLNPGESLFHTIERRARGRGILIHDTPEGKLKLATKPAGTHSGSIVRGRGIITASSTLTEKGRHSAVHVRGQMTEGTAAQQLRGQATAKDAGVSRERPLVIRHEGEALTDRMKTRAEWQVKRGAGSASTAEITVSGWRDDGGKIWTENYLVHVDDDWIGVNGMMIIKSVTLDQSDGGTTATLSLADPRALGGENPRGKTEKAYGAPGAIEAEFEEQ